MHQYNPKIVAFKNINIFNINFGVPNWHIIDFDNPTKYEADAFFQINVRKAKTLKVPEYNFIIESKKPVLVCESNLFRKNSYPITDPRCYFRLGWNHFLRCGEFNNRNSPPDRWNHIKNLQNLEVKDWRSSGSYILLVLQKPGDSTLNTMYEKYKNYETWISETLRNIRRHTDRPILIRPHLNTIKLNFEAFESEKDKILISKNFRNRTKIEGGQSLEEDFKGAWAVVGYNSNSLVESTLAGIPTFPLDSNSVVWEVSNQDKLENIENPVLNIDRTQWCYDSAYMIWTAKEIADGTAWNHLRGIYFDSTGVE